MYQLTIQDTNKTSIQLAVREGQTVFEAMQSIHPPVFRGNCGGRGQCMSCTVFVVETNTYEKACRLKVTESMHIRLPFAFPKTGTASAQAETDLPNDAPVGIAIDLGTTTIGMCLVSLPTQQCLCRFTLQNPQAVYGADVISRIAYASRPERANTLQTLVWSALLTGIQQMLAATQISSDRLHQIAIAANTTMVHLLMGYDTDCLGHAPFVTTHLHAVHTTLQALSEDIAIPSGFDHIRLDIYPGISAFVGADIVSGASYLQLGQQETYDLLIDFGTNGEILLVNARNGFAGATACGSAFDSYVTAKNYSTTLLSRIALLRKRGILSEQGLLAARYRTSGYSFVDGMTITMELIDAVLKTKSAIRTGIELLLDRAGVVINDCRVHLTGNFGFHMDLTSAAAIGMLPDVSEVTVTNDAALDGAVLLLCSPEEAYAAAEALIQRTQVYSFAQDSSFASRYVGHMRLD